MMTPSPIDLDRHHRLRLILRRHQNAAVKTMPRSVFRRAARRLGLLEGDELLAESESELTILVDYCIYSLRRHGRNLVSAYLTKLPPTDDPSEQVVRAAMARDRFSMYEVQRPHPGIGLDVRDLVRGGELFIVDEALSRTLAAGRVLGGRLLPLPNYWMTTGAGFPLSPEAVQILGQTFLPVLRLAERNLASLSPAAHEDLASVVIGAGLEAGTTSQIEYQ